jgi:serine/threonine-protein kinase ULK2
MAIEWGFNSTAAEGKAAEESGLNEKETQLIKELEKEATISDVVYAFANTKYVQVAPLLRESTNVLGNPRSSEMNLTDMDNISNISNNARYMLQNEAMVLFSKTLSILIKVAKKSTTWWTRYRSVTGTEKPEDSVAGKRVAEIVRWVAFRAEEIFEISERMHADRRSRMDAAWQPSSAVMCSRKSRDAYMKAWIGEFLFVMECFLSGVLPIKFSVARLEHFELTGSYMGTPSEFNPENEISAGKLLYDRAMGVSRSAVIKEHVNWDLSDCLLAHSVSIKMLDAISEDDDTGKTAKKRAYAWEYCPSIIEQRKDYLQQRLKLLGKTDTPKLMDLNRFNRTLDEISEWRAQPHFDDIELLCKDSAEKSK